MGSHNPPVRVLVVGESLVDLTRREGSPDSVRPGGSPLNVAVGLSRLQVPTSLASQVGEDEYGDLVRAHVDASGVALRSLAPHRHDTATALATIDAAGVATYRFDLCWDPAALPRPEGFDLVHIGSIGAVLAPGAEAVNALASEAHDRGVAVSLDPNVRPGITPDLEGVRRDVDSLTRLASICKLSDEDARVLYPDSSIDEVVERVLESGGPRLVALTLGDQGALLASPDAVARVPATRTTVVDTIGAGDSFMSALLAGLVRRGWVDRTTYAYDELTWLGHLAGMAAAITCSRAGADPPYAHELAEILS